MSENATSDLITINIDGKDVEVPKGINVIEAVKMAGKGKEVPHYCYHPKLSIAGNCRMCLVEMGMPMRDRATGEAVLDENGSQKVGWMPKPTIGCATNAAPGMHIKTGSPMVKESRNGVTEFLLINHPLDCPICDQAGECRLQEFSAEHGRGYSPSARVSGRESRSMMNAVSFARVASALVRKLRTMMCSASWIAALIPH